MKGLYNNTLMLIKFILKRERVISLIWVLSLVLISSAIAPGMASLFDDEARAQFAAVYDNPVMVAMLGPIYGADNYTAGAMYGGMMLLWYAIAVAVMNVFIVVRHTRANEEQGREEVIRSLPVGRLANINAVMISAAIINGILAVATGIGLFVTGVEGMDFASCMFYGAATGMAGLVFAAITAVFCQLSSNTSGAMGLSFMSLGAAYALRAAGDVGNETLSLISPLGLVQRSKAFVENDAAPLAGLLVIVLAFTALAYKLNSVRDLGQGFIPARPGRKTASKSLLSPFGLSLRLLRNTIIIWSAVMFIGAGSYGSVISDIPNFVSESPEYLQLMGIPHEMLEHIPDETKAEIIVDGFGAYVTSMMSLIALIPVLIAALKLRSEEKEGRVEHLLSRAVSRSGYLLCFTAISIVMSVIMQVATVLGLYYSTEAVLGGESNPFVLQSLFKASLVCLPAFWVMIGIAVLLTGLFPKLSGIAWGYYGFVCFSSLIGGMAVLPDWLTKLSPMAFIPEIRVTCSELFVSDEVNLVTLTAMCGVAVLLIGAGVAGYRNRDMT